MNNKVTIDALLLRLEDLSAQALSRTDPSAYKSGPRGEILELIQQRGQLIEELAQQLSGLTLTYIEWNRMLAIHKQGEQIETNLRQLRNQLATQAAASGRDRAFLDCVGGVLTQPDSSQKILA